MKMMKAISKYMVGSLLLLTTISSFGQQDPMYSQYMFNIQAYNPAYAGTWESIGLMALGRYQWVGFEGQPETQTFTIQAPLRGENIGLGMSVINDKVGFERRFAIFTDYSYRLKIDNQVYLRFGLKAGFTNYENIFSNYTTYTPNGQHDPSFDGVNEKKLMPNFGIGAFMYSPKFYVGFSIPKILQNDFELGVENYTTSFEYRHLTLIGGYVFDLSNDIKFKPSSIVRYVIGSPFVADFNFSFLFKEKFWFGAMVRSMGTFGFNTQFVINDKLRLGYAIDFDTSNLRSYQDGTHELMISYELNFLKTRYTSPRYF